TRIAVASNGTLLVDVVAEVRMAHSAYPELGESAIDKLLEALRRLQAMKLPADEEIGPTTLNIGMIQGGRAPNVIPDYAHADLLYRLVGPSQDLRQQIIQAVEGLARGEFVLEIPFVRLRTMDGLPSMEAAFTSGIPSPSDRGQPLLISTGPIHCAHHDGVDGENARLK